MRMYVFHRSYVDVGEIFQKRKKQETEKKITEIKVSVM